MTEKLVDPMFAHSIPIYIGDPQAQLSFDPASYIDFACFPNMKQMMEFVREVDNNPALYLRSCRRLIIETTQFPIMRATKRFWRSSTASSRRRSRDGRPQPALHRGSLAESQPLRVPLADVYVGRFQLRVFLQRVQRFVSSETRLLVAAERYLDAAAVPRIDGDGADT